MVTATILHQENLGPTPAGTRISGSRNGRHVRALQQVSLSLRFNGQFPVEPGLAGV